MDDKPITQSMPQPSNPVPPPVFYQPQLLPQPQSLPQPEPYPVPSPIYNQPIQTQPQPQPLNPNDPFQTQQNFIIVQQPNMLTHTVFGKYPQTVTCPNCQSQVVTIVEYEPGSGTWMTCLMLSLVGCLCGCCLIPFCVDSLKDAIHICPNCNAEVGKSEYIYKGGGSNYTPSTHTNRIHNSSLYSHHHHGIGHHHYHHYGIGHSRVGIGHTYGGVGRSYGGLTRSHGGFGRSHGGIGRSR